VCKVGDLHLPQVSERVKEPSMQEMGALQSNLIIKAIKVLLKGGRPR